MSEFSADHGQICSAFLRRSKEYLGNGQLLQASEKGWGAAAHAAMLLANDRRWSYKEHWEFEAEVISRLARETGQTEVYEWGRSANELHRNFYRDEFDAQQIATHLNGVGNLVNLIRRLTGLPPIND